jgi:hypothetical protein
MNEFFVDKGAKSELKFIIGWRRVLAINRSCVGAVTAYCMRAAWFARSLVNDHDSSLPSRLISVNGCCSLASLSPCVVVFRNLSRFCTTF